MKPRDRAGGRLAAALLGLWAGAALAGGWQLSSLDGDRISLSDYSGQWVVLNYWATWCKPCREEMPELDRLDRRRDDVTVLGVAWEDTSTERIGAFLDKHPVGYPVLLADPFQPPAGMEPPRVLPTTIVYAPDGSEAKRLHGPVTRTLIEEVIGKAGSKGGD